MISSKNKLINAKQYKTFYHIHLSDSLNIRSKYM